MRLDHASLLDLCKLSDADGVLSVYVDAAPERRTRSQPEWQITLKNALKDVRARVKAEGPRDRWVALERRLDEIARDLEELVDPKGHGRGRALFAGVTNGDLRTVALQMPLPDRVVFRSTAYVRPLVAALDEGRSAGIAVVDRSGLRLLDWRLGEAEQIVSRDFVEPDDWRELKGPAAGSPAMSQHSAPQRDLYEERLDEHRVRFLQAEATRLGAIVDARGWERLVVAGEARLAGPFADALPKRRGLTVYRHEHELRNQREADVAQSVHAVLDEAQRARELALVRDVTDRALARGQGVLGLSDTLAALGEGRVRHLLYDDGREPSGFRTPDGRLLPDGDGVSHTRAELEHEPLLFERMVERCFETGADVTPVDGAAAEALAAHDGVAALLRW